MRDARGAAAARARSTSRAGPGYLTRHLAGAITGLDQSASMIEIASARMPAGRVRRRRRAAAAVRRRRLRAASSPATSTGTSRSRARFLAEARRVAGELVVVDSAVRPDHEPVEWQERVLNDGSRHEVYKRYFTGEGLAEELGGGEVLHAGPWFVRGAGAAQSRPVSSSRSMPSAARMRGTVPCSARAGRAGCARGRSCGRRGAWPRRARARGPAWREAPQRGLVRRQLAGRSTPLASIPTVPSTRSKSRWIASRSSWGVEPGVAQRVAGACCRRPRARSAGARPRR